MNKLIFVSSLLAVASSAMAWQVSIGIRETAAGGGADVGVGNNGGTAGGIEWINKDATALITDGAWHLYTWALTGATVTAFAGGTANGTLQGNYGTLENIRILNNGGSTNAITLWIDDVTSSNAAGSTNFGSFESYAANAVARFQRANFSGSSTNVTAGATAGVDTSTAHTGVNSYKFNWSHTNNLATNWARLTSGAGGGMLDPNSMVRLDNDATISFWAKATVVPEPATMAVLGLGVAALIRRRKR
ncbi:MAG: PEP-CTERM sorting domain-containing protein [Fimbriimonadaceae bacterium]|nr:PEP-CTERM sorting domain-containing protein [Fimbriimonadaceae bacterium]